MPQVHGGGTLLGIQKPSALWLNIVTLSAAPFICVLSASFFLIALSALFSRYGREILTIWFGSSHDGQTLLGLLRQTLSAGDGGALLRRGRVHQGRHLVAKGEGEALQPHVAGEGHQEDLLTEREND